MPHRRSLAVFLAVLLTLLAFGPGCSLRDSTLEHYLTRFGHQGPTPYRFQTCVRFGCKQSEPVGLSEEQWLGVRGLFVPPAADAAGERERIRLAVARMEALVGPMAGTERDLPENQGGQPGSLQLDCVAESVNTTTVLTILEDEGLLRFHTVRLPEKRGFGVFYPHNTAVIVETATGTAWAVDSWFGPNAAPPDMVELSVWRNGWHPGDPVTAHPRP